MYSSTITYERRPPTSGKASHSGIYSWPVSRSPSSKTFLHLANPSVQVPSLPRIFSKVTCVSLVYQSFASALCHRQILLRPAEWGTPSGIPPPGGLVQVQPYDVRLHASVLSIFKVMQGTDDPGMALFTHTGGAGARAVVCVHHGSQKLPC